MHRLLFQLKVNLRSNKAQQLKNSIKLVPCRRFIQFGFNTMFRIFQFGWSSLKWHCLYPISEWWLIEVEIRTVSIYMCPSVFQWRDILNQNIDVHRQLNVQCAYRFISFIYSICERIFGSINFNVIAPVIYFA